MAKAAQSMILDMLKTPQQVREQQLAKIREQSASQAQLLAQPVRGTTALPGLLSRFAAGEALEQRADLNKAARRASGAVGSALSMAGYDEAAKAATQAMVTPEERLAQNRQEVLKGIDQSNPQQLALAAKKLQSMGDGQGSMALINRAQTLEKNAAQTALTREQARTELSKRLKNMAAANKSDAERAQLIAESGLRLSKLETEVLLNETRARKTSAETDRMNALLPFEIDETIANIALKEAQADKTAEEIAEIIKQSDAQLSLLQAKEVAQLAIAEKNRAQSKEIIETLPQDKLEIASRISLNAAREQKTLEEMATEIVMRIPELKALEQQTALDAATVLATDALTRKRNVETGAAEAKLPGELALQTAALDESKVKTEEIKSRIELNKANLANMNMTDFMRELNASGLDDAEKENLIRQRVKVRAKTGDVLAEDLTTKAQVDAYVKQIQKGEQALMGLRAAEQAILVLPDASVGPLAPAEDFVNKLLVKMGYGDVDKDFANTVLAVFSGQETLQAAQMLKGTFSDRDIAFIQSQVPQQGWNFQTLSQTFDRLYLKRYTEYNTARAFENNLGTTDFTGVKILNLQYDYEQKYYKDALIELNKVRQRSNQMRANRQQR